MKHRDTSHDSLIRTCKVSEQSSEPTPAPCSLSAFPVNYYTKCILHSPLPSMLVCKAHWQTSSQAAGPALHHHPPWDTSYFYVLSESRFSIPWSCPASLSGYPKVLFSQCSDVVANKKTSRGFGDEGSHSLIGSFNARRKREAKRACTFLLLTDTPASPWAGRAQLTSLTDPTPLCGYLGVWRITWLLPVRPQSSLFCTPISLKRERRSEGEAMLYYFYTYPEIWAFNLSLICTLLVATGPGFTSKPSGNVRCCTWSQTHK